MRTVIFRPLPELADIGLSDLEGERMRVVETHSDGSMDVVYDREGFEFTAYPGELFEFQETE